jgi:MtN3 and saliva related transmembrane protein
MDLITLLGMVAGSLTTLAFVPQVLKTWKTRSAGDLSIEMLITFCTGLFLWLIYGICINSLPVILANLITLVLAVMILGFKLWFR